MRLAIAPFVVLHGLVHLWYLALSLRLVPFRPDMGWTGRSWLLSSVLGDATLRPIAAVLFASLTLAFVVAGTMLALGVAGWRPLLLGSAVISAVVLVTFWDGGLGLVVEKGALGLAIDVAIVVVLIVLG